MRRVTLDAEAEMDDAEVRELTAYAKETCPAELPDPLWISNIVIQEGVPVGYYIDLTVVYPEGQPILGTYMYRTDVHPPDFARRMM